MRRCIRTAINVAGVRREKAAASCVHSKRFATFVATIVIHAAAILSVVSTSNAQVPQEAKSVKDFRKIFYRNTPTGKVPEAICSGAEANPLTGSQVQLKDFTLETLRDQVTQFIAKSPECVIDVKEEYASSAGPLRGFSATTNFYIQGVGFLCTKSNSLLVISNQVETRIEKAVLKGPGALGAKTNASGEIVKIFSDQFRMFYQSNIAIYSGNVRVVDTRMTLTCDLLTTHFGTNGSIQNITAERNVVLTQTNGSRATGDMAVYSLVGTNETVDLIGHARWNDGPHDVTARSFFYDGRADTLQAADGVKVRVANSTHRPARNADDFSELFANEAIISNATRKHAKAQDILAQGDVKMTNHFDRSYAQSYRATYSETNGVIELSGRPVLRNEQGEISGYVLSIDRSNNVFRSRGDTLAIFRPRETTTKKQAVQMVRIKSSDLDYSTNEAHFSGHVHGTAFSGSLVAGELNCESLLLRMGASNQVVSAVAEGNVYAEKAARKQAMQILHCDLLTVNRNPATGNVRDVDASGHCKFEEKTDAPKAEMRTLTATNFHAEFSPVTNKVERFVAEGGIVGMQTTAMRTNKVDGAKLVYTFAPIQKIEVTGHPKAQTDRAIISNADLFTWLVQSNTFRATGRYKITPTPGSKSLPSR
jgi:lipopolysaccharide export system protein LptA